MYRMNCACIKRRTFHKRQKKRREKSTNVEQRPAVATADTTTHSRLLYLHRRNYNIHLYTCAHHVIECTHIGGKMKKGEIAAVSTTLDRGVLWCEQSSDVGWDPCASTLPWWHRCALGSHRGSPFCSLSPRETLPLPPAVKERGMQITLSLSLSLSLLLRKHTETDEMTVKKEGLNSPLFLSPLSSCPMYM